MDVVFAGFASLISLVFALLVFRQYLRRRRIHQAVWAVGLLMFALAAGTEATARAVGWNEPLFRLWFVAGAYFGAVYLGMGTIYLLLSRRVADTLLIVVVVASLFAVALVLSTPIDLSRMAQGMSEPLGPPGSLPRILTPIFNIFGTVALVGGAFYSAWRARGAGLLSPLVYANLLIGLGGLTVALTHSPGKFGVFGLLALGELLGITLIFIGFLRSR